MPYPVIFSDPLAVGLLLLDKVLKIFETNKFIFHGEHFWLAVYVYLALGIECSGRLLSADAGYCLRKVEMH